MQPLRQLNHETEHVVSDNTQSEMLRLFFGKLTKDSDLIINITVVAACFTTNEVYNKLKISKHTKNGHYMETVRSSVM